MIQGVELPVKTQPLKPAGRSEKCGHFSLITQACDFVRGHGRGTHRARRALVPLQGVAAVWANHPGIQEPAQGCALESVPGRAGLGVQTPPWGPRVLLGTCRGSETLKGQFNLQVMLLRETGSGLQRCPRSFIFSSHYSSQRPRTRETAVSTFITQLNTPIPLS